MKPVTVRSLHCEAMDRSSEAMVAAYYGRHQEARDWYARALEFEVKACRMVDRVPESEPTRGILYLGAGWIAINAGNYAAARELAAEGLFGYPTGRVLHDLWELIEAVV